MSGGIFAYAEGPAEHEAARDETRCGLHGIVHHKCKTNSSPRFSSCGEAGGGAVHAMPRARLVWGWRTSRL